MVMNVGKCQVITFLSKDFKELFYFADDKTCRNLDFIIREKSNNGYCTHFHKSASIELEIIEYALVHSNTGLVRFILRKLTWNDPIRLPSHEPLCRLIDLDTQQTGYAPRAVFVTYVLTSRIGCRASLSNYIIMIDFSHCGKAYFCTYVTVKSTKALIVRSTWNEIVNAFCCASAVTPTSAVMY